MLCTVWRRACAAVLGLGLSSSAALASFSPIHAPPPGEMTHAQILSHVYGGTFTPGLRRPFDLSNGTIVAERIEDRITPSVNESNSEGRPIDMGGSFAEGTGGPEPTDRLWNANFTGAVAEAKFAIFPQDFGFFDGAAGGSYRKLFDLQGSGFSVTGTANLSPAAGHLIRWGRSGEARTFSSREADNSDVYDHLVTYEIHDLGAQGVPGGGSTMKWLIFWEDAFLNEPSDLDYNDLVVEIRAAVVPEPGCGAIALLGRFGALARRARD
jgi:hypothetical protein